MNAVQLSEKAFHYVWSALHFPNEPNHAGKKILELLKYNAMSSLSKSIFKELEDHKSFSNAGSVLVEIENLFLGNQNLQNQVRNAIIAGANDSMIPMPPTEREMLGQSTQVAADSSDGFFTGGRVIGFLVFTVGLGLTIASGGQAIFYGAILYGFIKMITG